MVDKREHDHGMIIDYGDDVRIERRFRPEHEQRAIVDRHLPGRPQRVDPKTREPLFEDVIKLDKSNQPIYTWVCYQTQRSKEDQKEDPTTGEMQTVRLHPAHGGVTTFDYAWVIKGEGTREEMEAMAEKLVADAEPIRGEFEKLKADRLDAKPV